MLIVNININLGLTQNLNLLTGNFLLMKGIKSCRFRIYIKSLIKSFNINVKIKQNKITLKLL